METSPKTWDVSVGQTAPGLGVVIDKKQMMPNYDEKIRYSGNSGYLVLIVRPNIALGLHPFTVHVWMYGEDEPRFCEEYAYTLDQIYEIWKKLTENM